MNKLARFQPKAAMEAKARLREPVWATQIRTRLKSMHAPEEYVVLSTVVPRSRKIAAPVRRAIIESAVSSYQALAKVRNKSVDHTVVLVNAILASDISHSMEVWTKQLAEGGTYGL